MAIAVRGHQALHHTESDVSRSYGVVRHPLMMESERSTVDTHTRACAWDIDTAHMRVPGTEQQCRILLVAVSV